MTMQESAARHMAAGVEDLDELARLVEQDTGKVPNRLVLSDHRSRFRQHGEGWIEARRATGRERTIRWCAQNPAKKLFNQCRQSARLRGYECTITAEMIEAMLAPMVCSATGLPLTWEHPGGSTANPWAPSLDRIDCSKGYVPGNVRVVCWAFNQMRGEFPDEVVMTLAKAVAARAP